MTTTFPTRPVSDYPKLVARLTDQLRRLGYDAKPGSRFDTFGRALCAAGEHGWEAATEQFGASIMVRAVEDVCELEAIMHVYAGAIPKAAQGVFEDLMRGSVLPEDEGRDSQPRSSQFHLYLAALLRLGGLCAEFQEPPDLTVELGGVPFGVAAKRVRSRAQVVGRISDGGRQLRAAKMRGIVCVRVTDTLGLTSAGGFVFKSGAEKREWEERVEQWFDRGVRPAVEEELRRMSSKEHVLGVCVFWELRARMHGSDDLESMNWAGWVGGHPEGSASEQWSEQLSQAIERGLEVATRLTHIPVP